MTRNMLLTPAIGYRNDVGLLLAALEDSSVEWQSELGSPPSEAITWQPYERSYSIGGILLHMISVEFFWLCKVLGRCEATEAQKAAWMVEETNVDDGIWPLAPNNSINWYLEQLREVRQIALSLLKSIDPDLTVELRGETFSMKWILSHVVQHDSYHGGQAVLLHEQWKKWSQK